MGRVCSPLLCLALGWSAIAWLPAARAEEPAQKNPAGSEPGASKADDAVADDASTDETYDLYQSFADTIDQVERNYVKKVDRRQLMEAAIHGVLSKLDPYSNYIGPEDLARFRSSVENQFGGIGIQIDIKHDKLVILSPIFGSPAYRAGLESGDHIIEIEGKSTDGLSIDDAIRQLKGEAGTSVTFAVVHPGQTKKEVITIKREIIHVDTVLGDTRKENDHWDFMLDHDKHIGYIRISGFSRDTARDLKAALEELKSQGLAGLVIDLRFNPGGLLTSAIEISDMFISEGRIVSTKGRNTPERVWDATREGTYVGFPVAVLVNHFSASASEIFSACLQDHHRAVIIGERTWGKGSVQNVIDLENGRSALKLTTASYQRPSGKNIHRFPDAKETDEWGVMPDKGFECRLNDDREMVALMRYRRERDILHSHKAPLAVAAGDAQKSTDEQAAAEKPTAEKPAAQKAADGAVDSPTAPEESREKTGAAKASDASSEDAKPAEAKPDAAKPNDAKPDDAQSSDAKPNDADHKTAKANHPFVDRQLQKALDYLSHEMAGAAAVAPEPKRE